jgi:hypothetical protein
VAALVLSGNQRTVTPAYRGAALRWVAGEPLYTAVDHGFIYLPQAAVLFVPFAALPPRVGDVVWRLVTISVFALGVQRLAALAERDSGQSLFLTMTWVCVPLVLAAAVNGQSTLLVTGMMLLATEDVVDGRWSRAAAWMALGLAVKPLMTPLLLLSAALHPPLRSRLALGLAALFLAPFLLQRPAYVSDAYAQWAALVGRGATGDVPGHWADLYGMLGVAGIAVPGPLRMAGRGVALVGALALCAVASRRRTPAQAGVLLFVFSACYLMLFNPRTELNTYAALAPAVAVLFAQAWIVDGRRLAAAGLIAVGVGIKESFEVGTRLAPEVPPIWLAPIACVGLVVYAVYEACRVTARPVVAPRRA